MQNFKIKILRHLKEYLKLKRPDKQHRQHYLLHLNNTQSSLPAAAIGQQNMVAATELSTPWTWQSATPLCSQNDDSAAGAML